MTIQRNNTTHGGDIVLDIEAIRADLAKNKSTWSIFMEPFQRMYGISFTEATNLVKLGLSKEVIIAYNERVNLEIMDFWQRPENFMRKGEAQGLSSHILKTHEATPEKDRAALFAYGGKLYGSYQRLLSIVAA
jgi:hypothetical protein